MRGRRSGGCSDDGDKDLSMFQASDESRGENGDFDRTSSNDADSKQVTVQLSTANSCEQVYWMGAGARHRQPVVEGTQVDQEAGMAE